MDLTGCVDSLHADLLQVAEAGGPDLRAAADRLYLGPRPRGAMTLLNVLADAAAEITHDLPSGGVEVCVR